VNGVTSFPSVSGYAYYPFMTGVPAAHSGVAGIRWFDRSRTEGNFRNYIGATSVNLNADFAPSIPTLFEMFPDDNSTSTNDFVNRGAKKVIIDEWSYALSTYGNAKEAEVVRAMFPAQADYFSGTKAAMQVAIDDLAARPKIQWVTLPHLDAIFHFEGPTPKYVQALQLTDALIASYRAASVLDGTEAERIYAVVSDHGGAEVTKHFDVAQYLDQLGIAMDRDIAVHLLDSKLRDPVSRYDDRSAIVAIQGNLMTHVYLRKPGVVGAAGWATPRTRAELAAYPTPHGPIDLVATFRAQPGISLVVVREGDHRIGLYDARGAAEITVADKSYSYRIVDGEDPLGYRGDPHAGALVGTGRHPSRDWLTATYQTRFPDTVAQLGSFMSEPGPGDLVLVAAADYDLADDFEPIVGNFHGGHGGLEAGQFRVPFIVSGPGVKHTRVDTARAEDIGATLEVLMHARPSRAPEGDVLPIVEP
jgi:hypothetical protein